MAPSHALHPQFPSSTLVTRQSGSESNTTSSTESKDGKEKMSAKESNKFAKGVMYGFLGVTFWSLLDSFEQEDNRTIERQKKERHFALCRSVSNSDYDKIHLIIQESDPEEVNNCVRYEVLSGAKDERELRKLMKIFNFTISTDQEWKRLLAFSLKEWGISGRSKLSTWILSRIDPNLIQPHEFDEMLSGAIKKYDVPAVEALLELSPSLRAKSHHLDSALKYGELTVDMVRVLVERGGVTPSGAQLMKVVKNEREFICQKEKDRFMELISLLVDHGADVKYMNDQFISPYELVSSPDVRKMLKL